MGTIAEKLTYLDGTKLALREAINLAGGGITDTTPFRQYANWVRKQSASLSLDFVREEYIARNAADNKIDRFGFDNIITFTRGSGGGRTNADGNFKWVGNNVPRLDYGHDVVTPARTNLLTYSEQFDNAAWTRGGSTVGANSVISPDGTASADKLTEDSSAATTHRVFRAFSATTNAAHTYSMFLKKDTRTWVRVSLFDGSATWAAFFNLVDGVIGTISGVGATAKIESVGSDWYRCSVSATGAFTQVATNLATADNVIIYTGDGVSGVYIWGAQLEVGSVATDYIPTVASPVTIPAVLELNPRGILIEEQRTNLNTYSEQINSANYDTTIFPSTLVANAAISPSGLADASLLSPTTSSTAHAIFRTGAQHSYTSGTAYSASIYAKNVGGRYLQLTLPSAAFGASQYANFDLQNGVLGTVAGGTAAITPVGNGWFRCAFSASATATAAGAPGSIVIVPSATSGRVAGFVGVPENGIYIWGAQLEAGAFPTSYIPTVASQVTRSADVVSVNTLSPWYNASEGTLVAAYRPGAATSSGTARRVASLSDGTLNNRIVLGFSDTAGIADAFVMVGGSSQLNITTPVQTLTDTKAAFAFKSSDFGYSLNGGIVTQLSGSIPVPSILYIGVGEDGVSSPALSPRILNGHIQSLEYYPRRLSNTELQEITA